MPIFPRVDANPKSGEISAGITVGATIGGVLLVAVAVAGAFILIRRWREGREGAPHRSRTATGLRRSDTIGSFRSRGDDDENDVVNGLLTNLPDHKKYHARNDSDAPLLHHTRGDSSSSWTPGTPSRPRIEIEIPPSPLPQSTAFRQTMLPSDRDALSAVPSSACMSSASPTPTPHSAFALSAFAFPGASSGAASVGDKISPMPVRSVEAARTVVAQRSATAGTSLPSGAQPPRASVHPIPLHTLPGGPRTTALMQLPSDGSNAFVFPGPAESAWNYAQNHSIEEEDESQEDDDVVAPAASNAKLGAGTGTTTTLDAAVLSDVIRETEWGWADTSGARATIAVLGREPSGSASSQSRSRAASGDSAGEGDGTGPRRMGSDRLGSVDRKLQGPRMPKARPST